MNAKRVLIVDDSATIRQLIRARLAGDTRLEVVGEAHDPYDAREKIKALQPDVLTLDVEMPRMNGLQFLEKVMTLRPLPVVMVSTLTQRGSAAALEALSLGAVDCVGKPQRGSPVAAFANLPDILVMAADARLRLPGNRRKIVPSEGFVWNGRVVLIGSSTGGVDALETVLSGFPKNCPPTLITQHMPESFLASFARRLQSNIAPNIILAREGVPLAQGSIYLAPGGAHHLEVRPGNPEKCHLSASEKRNGHRPSVEVLFDSAVPIASKVVSVMLTGMGRDGADAMLRLRKNGARCLAQDAASCVVYGMPRAAAENGAAEKALPLRHIAKEVLDLCGRSAERSVNKGRSL
ncbi:chemotaxis response regulator protein-glutamate methylesterase [Thioclava sp. SK-1]|uniref:protein-glutamate methylesterase/protein-glutamine glutaminase n=1 Tax=Thioclava sp. SK-1 TaxID=1889770 RepID=UPI00082568BA|nr:chemotaxis response regulator protein-glutamate methylesterase [Thioclava sp. SK-1]OCX67112.1 chemotaxis response regulator protein-glutamate methylesterase [Thioclava sp. SK-1]